MRLVDEYMETRQPLPDNDHALARICGISLEQWHRDACGIVRAFFEAHKGMLFHDRCDKILAEQDEREKKHSEKSKKGAEARWKKNKDLNAAGIAEALPKDATLQDNTIQDKKDNPPIPPSGEKPAKEIPPLFDNFWKLYPKQRAGSKEKALTAYRNALTRTTEEIINEAVINYAGSDEVKRKFAKGAAAWLNDDRWTVDYSAQPQTGGAQGKPAYGDIIENATRRVLDQFRREDDLRAEAD